MKQFLLLVGIMFCVFINVNAQTITGTVTDESGEPLIGANVVLKGTSTGTVTEFDGTFEMEASNGDVLVVSYTGYGEQEITVGADSNYSIILSEGVMLGDVVVTALGISKDEKSLGYAVQEVETEDIIGANETNFVQALAGKAAGVQVTGSSGAAGASSYILIRGANTISGNNQPLIVVDGIPINNDQLRSGDEVASVAYSNRAIDINQDEIENVTILKGAAATAIYGSLAGNGAILITTKKGKIGQKSMSIDFSTNVTFSQISQVPELQSRYAQGAGGFYNGPETGQSRSYGPLIDTLRYVDNGGDFWTDPNAYPFSVNGSIVGQSASNASSRAVQTYDPYDFFQTAVSTRNALGITAANEWASARFSLGYQFDEGVIPNNDFQKINLGVNVNSKLSEKVKLGMGVQYINSGGTRIEQGSNVSGVMLGLLRTSPTFDNANGTSDPVNDERSYLLPNGAQRNYRGGGGYDNPFWTVNQNPLEDNVNRIIGNITLEYNPTDWLKITYRPGVDFYSDFRSQFFAIGSRTVPTGRVFEDQYNFYQFNADLFANLTHKFSDKLEGSLLIGHNMRATTVNNLYSQGDGLVINNFYDLSNANSTLTTQFSNRERAMAYYTSIDLAYNNMLYLTLTGRFEGETTLPVDNQWFPYGSVSTSFVFTELMENDDVLSFGKIRLSYGTVGLGAFTYATNTYFTQAGVADGWTEGFAFPFQGTAAFTQSGQLGNPNLRPERNTSFEAGVDLRFFQDRLGLDFTYYNGKSTDIILAVPIAPSSGFTSQVSNAASMSNRGVEVVLSGTPVRQAGFRWDAEVNFTANRNEVVELAEGIDQVYLGGFVGSSTRAVVGVPYSTIFGFGFYRDANGNRVIGADGFPILDPEEKAFDTAQPDWTMGIRNTFSYKGVSLSALVDIKQGGVMWNGTRSALYFFGMHQETADLRGTVKVFDGMNAVYDAEGNLMFDANGNPMTDGDNSTAVLIDEGWLSLGNANGFIGDNTEDFIEETSWVRLRDLTLSYAFPSSILKGSPFKGLSLSFTGRNLILVTPYKGVDPETNLYGSSNAQGLDYFNMPGTRSYAIGLRANF